MIVSVARSILVASWASTTPRHRDGTHAPVEYALHSWFIPSDVAMSTHEMSQMAHVAAYFTTDASAKRKRHGKAVCPSGEDNSVSAPFRKLWYEIHLSIFSMNQQAC
jgi:hypothetical protein